jgi:pyruvate/2-oxoglutarate dehydrogenase complex dihydrolipoamide dehydrogenase (E3) component
MPTIDQHFDAIVLGCGSAGTTAAKRLRTAGRSVAVVERDQPGGDCPLRACVPTKALLRSAQVFALLRRAGEFGLSTGDIACDWSRVVARKERIVQATGTAEAAARLEKRGIIYLHAEATLEDARHVRVDGRILSGERILIATGSRPARPAFPGFDEVQPITSAQAVQLPSLPASLIILGGGPVGCEFAHLFSTFGVRVTLLHHGKVLLPREEPELSLLVREVLVENGVTVETEAEVKHLQRSGKCKEATVDQAGKMRTFDAEEILLATGRTAETADLGLRAAGVATDQGRVRINDYLQSSQPHIYAAGDVCGPLQYTHFAHYQGRVAAENLFAQAPTPADYRVVPRVTFTEPAIASVGLTEQQARQAGHAVRCTTFAIRSLGKALVESEEAGLVKLVADAQSGEILGGHIAAVAAGEMIHEVVAAMTVRAKVHDLAQAIHAFPNFAEGVKAAARQWMEEGELP